MLELEERRLKNLKPRKEEKELPNSRKNIIKLFKSGTLNLRQNMLLNMNQLKLNQRKKKRKLLLKEVKLPQLKPQTKVKLIQKPLPKLPQLKKPQKSWSSKERRTKEISPSCCCQNRKEVRILKNNINKFSPLSSLSICSWIALF